MVTLTVEQVVIPGDVNGDGLVNVDDIDAISAGIRAGSTDASLDVNGDGTVDRDGDVNMLVQDILGSAMGDANLDQRVSIGDLSILSSNFGKDINSGDTVGWAQGDFNGDGRITIGDLSILSANMGFDGTVNTLVASALDEQAANTEDTDLGDSGPYYDLNGDGLVNRDDAKVLRNNLGTIDAGRADGDLNGDGRVDRDDLHLFRKARRSGRS